MLFSKAINPLLLVVCGLLAVSGCAGPSPFWNGEWDTAGLPPMLVGGPTDIDLVYPLPQPGVARVEIRSSVFTLSGKKFVCWSETTPFGRVARLPLPAIVVDPATGIKPVFEYRVCQGEEKTRWCPYRLPPREKNASLRLAAYGDSRSNPRIHGILARAIARRKPDLVANTGDLVGRGTNLKLWPQQYLEPLTPLTQSVPIYTVSGNHEKEAEIYYHLCSRNAEGKGWWSTDVGCVHLVGVNTNVSLLADKEQRQWLAADLAASRGQRTWTIVMLHHPLFTGNPRRTARADVRALHDIFEKYGVDLVLQGHDHHLMRTMPVTRHEPAAKARGVVYVTTGGGGATLYDVKPQPFAAHAKKAWHYLWLDITPERIVGEAVDYQGKKIDFWRMKPGEGMPGPRYQLK